MSKSSWKSTPNTSEPRAVRSYVEGHNLVVALDDGRLVRAELARYPRLNSATPAQLANWRLIGHGVGLHWPDLDEDLSVAGLVRDGVIVESPERTEPSHLVMMHMPTDLRANTVSSELFAYNGEPLIVVTGEAGATNNPDTGTLSEWLPGAAIRSNPSQTHRLDATRIGQLLYTPPTREVIGA